MALSTNHPRVSRAGTKSRLDLVGSRLGDFMLPNPHDLPTGVGQQTIGFPIPGHVPVKLCLPPRNIAFGQGGVLRALMPPTTVDKHGDLLSGKDHVGLASDVWHRSAMNPVPETSAMQLSPKRQLRSRVSLRLVAHPLSGDR